MKKAFLIFLISLMSTSSTFADIITINNLQRQMPWQLSKDNQYDLQNKQPAQMIIVSVNSFIIKNGTPLDADRVTINCDGFIAYIAPGATEICPLSAIGHHVKIYISQENYLNGAEGTFDIMDVPPINLLK